MVTGKFSSCEIPLKYVIKHNLVFTQIDILYFFCTNYVRNPQHSSENIKWKWEANDRGNGRSRLCSGTFIARKKD